jgi:hypothetical protein
MASAPLYVAFGAVKDAVNRDEESGFTVSALKFIHEKDKGHATDYRNPSVLLQHSSPDLMHSTRKLRCG